MTAHSVFISLLLPIAMLGCAKRDDAPRSAAKGDAPGGETSSAAAPSSAALPVLHHVPAFSYANYDGRTIADKDLNGKVYLVEFFFSTCTGPCPIMNRNAAALQKEFAPVPNFRIVSFTVDPDNDTPERLAEYARSLDANRDRWYFLRGKQHEIGAMAADGFKMGDEEDPMMHSTHFALVDTKGMIRGYYDATDSARMGVLKREIRRLTGARS
jgi:protein SCO1